MDRIITVGVGAYLAYAFHIRVSPRRTCATFKRLRLFSFFFFFSLSLSLSRLLRFFRGPFFLGTHSRTHVTCARSTRHSRMRYAYVRGFFDVTNLNASSVDRWREGEGRASAPPIFLLWTGIGSSLEMLVLLENGFSFLWNFLIGLISSFFFPS